MDRLPRVFESARDRRLALGALVVLVVAVGAFTLALDRAIPWLTEPRAVRQWVADFGALAPAVFFLLQAGQVIVAPIPGHVMGLVSGYLFGVVVGTAISLSGAVVGTYVVLVASRRFGRPFVERVVHGDTLERFDGLSGRQGLLALFLVFLLPGVPDDVICFVAGLTTLPIWRMVVVSAIGRLPGFFVANLTGARLAQGRYGDVALIVGAAALVLGVAYVYRRRIVRRLGLEGAAGD